MVHKLLIFLTLLVLGLVNVELFQNLSSYYESGIDQGLIFQSQYQAGDYVRLGKDGDANYLLEVSIDGVKYQQYSCDGHFVKQIGMREYLIKDLNCCNARTYFQVGVGQIWETSQGVSGNLGIVKSDAIDYGGREYGE